MWRSRSTWAVQLIFLLVLLTLAPVKLASPTLALGLRSQLDHHPKGHPSAQPRPVRDGNAERHQHQQQVQQQHQREQQHRHLDVASHFASSHSETQQRSPAASTHPTDPAADPDPSTSTSPPASLLASSAAATTTSEVRGGAFSGTSISSHIPDSFAFQSATDATITTTTTSTVPSQQCQPPKWPQRKAGFGSCPQDRIWLNFSDLASCTSSCSQTSFSFTYIQLVVTVYLPNLAHLLALESPIQEVQDRVSQGGMGSPSDTHTLQQTDQVPSSTHTLYHTDQDLEPENGPAGAVRKPKGSQQPVGTLPPVKTGDHKLLGKSRLQAALESQLQLAYSLHPTSDVCTCSGPPLKVKGPGGGALEVVFEFGNADLHNALHEEAPAFVAASHIASHMDWLASAANIPCGAVVSLSLSSHPDPLFILQLDNFTTGTQAVQLCSVLESPCHPGTQHAPSGNAGVRQYHDSFLRDRQHVRSTASGVLQPAKELIPKSIQPATEVAIESLQPAVDVVTELLQPAREVTTKSLQPATEMTPKSLQPATDVATESLQPATDVATELLPPATEVTPESLQPVTDVATELLLSATDVTTKSLQTGTDVSHKLLLPATDATAGSLQPTSSGSSSSSSSSSRFLSEHSGANDSDANAPSYAEDETLMIARLKGLCVKEDLPVDPEGVALEIIGYDIYSEFSGEEMDCNSEGTVASVLQTLELSSTEAELACGTVPAEAPYGARRLHYRRHLLADQSTLAPSFQAASRGSAGSAAMAAPSAELEAAAGPEDVLQQPMYSGQRALAAVASCPAGPPRPNKYWLMVTLDPGSMLTARVSSLRASLAAMLLSRNLCAGIGSDPGPKVKDVTTRVYAFATTSSATYSCDRFADSARVWGLELQSCSMPLAPPPLLAENPEDGSGGGSSQSAGMIVGVTVGALVGLLLVAAGGVHLWRRRHYTRVPSSSSPDGAHANKYSRSPRPSLSPQSSLGSRVRKKGEGRRFKIKGITKLSFTKGGGALPVSLSAKSQVQARDAPSGFSPIVPTIRLAGLNANICGMPEATCDGHSMRMNSRSSQQSLRISTASLYDPSERLSSVWTSTRTSRNSRSSRNSRFSQASMRSSQRFSARSGRSSSGRDSRNSYGVHVPSTAMEQAMRSQGRNGCSDSIAGGPPTSTGPGEKAVGVGGIGGSWRSSSASRTLSSYHPQEGSPLAPLGQRSFRTASGAAPSAGAPLEQRLARTSWPAAVQSKALPGKRSLLDMVDPTKSEPVLPVAVPVFRAERLEPRVEPLPLPQGSGSGGARGGPSPQDSRFTDKSAVKSRASHDEATSMEENLNSAQSSNKSLQGGGGGGGSGSGGQPSAVRRLLTGMLGRVGVGATSPPTYDALQGEVVEQSIQSICQTKGHEYDHSISGPSRWMSYTTAPAFYDGSSPLHNIEPEGSGTSLMSAPHCGGWSSIHITPEPGSDMLMWRHSEDRLVDRSDSRLNPSQFVQATATQGREPSAPEIPPAYSYSSVGSVPMTPRNNKAHLRSRFTPARPPHITLPSGSSSPATSHQNMPSAFQASYKQEERQVLPVSYNQNQGQALLLSNSQEQGQALPVSYNQDQGQALPVSSNQDQGQALPVSHNQDQGQALPVSYNQNQGQAPPVSNNQNQGQALPVSNNQDQGQALPVSYNQNQGQAPPVSYTHRLPSIFAQYQGLESFSGLDSLSMPVPGDGFYGYMNMVFDPEVEEDSDK